MEKSTHSPHDLYRKCPEMRKETEIRWKKGEQERKTLRSTYQGSEEKNRSIYDPK